MFGCWCYVQLYRVVTRN